MNLVALMGRLTRDPDVKYTQGDAVKVIARYTLAVDRRFGQKDENGNYPADFIPCVVFGKGAEFAEKYLHKGTKIAVTGRIQTGSYTNKDGVKVYTTDVIVDSQEFAESRNGNAAGAGNGAAQYGGQPAASGGGYGNGYSGYGAQAGGYGQPAGYGQTNQGSAPPAAVSSNGLPPGYQMAADIPPVQKRGQYPQQSMDIGGNAAGTPWGGLPYA